VIERKRLAHLDGRYLDFLCRSRETVDGESRDVALTPRHNAGVVAMWEREDVGRMGFEMYLTGRQRLEENPFSSTSERYVIVCLLAERQIGRFRLFINGENLTGVRQEHQRRSSRDVLIRHKAGRLVQRSEQ
jgi:outer membrane receptor for ferrienterochelin and colicins